MNSYLLVFVLAYFFQSINQGNTLYRIYIYIYTILVPIGFKTTEIPSDFDWRTENSNCISSPRNQGMRSDNWVFAAAGAFEDRFCIDSKSTNNPTISVENLLSCMITSLPSSSYNVWLHFEFGGGIADWCYPYTSYWLPSDLCIPPCWSVCFPLIFIPIPHKYYAEDIDQCPNLDEDCLKREIIEGGPITMGLDAPVRILEYKGGIFTCEEGEDLIKGAYELEVIGWGIETENNMGYWIAKNSLGKNWGEDGYIRIDMRSCGFGKYSSFGKPIIPTSMS